MRLVSSSLLVCGLLVQGSHVRAQTLPPSASSSAAVSEVKPDAVPAHRTNENLHATLWIQTSVEWQVSNAQAYSLATSRLKQELANKTQSAATEQTGNFKNLPPAIIFDIDETVLDNSPFEARQIKNDKSWDPVIWSQWVQEGIADPIPGAVDFVKEARKLGITVFFVSNRSKEDKSVTVANLKKVGFPVYPDGSNVLLMGERPEWGVDKSSRRQLLAKKYRIMMLVGDDFNDFVSAAPKSLAERQALSNKYQSHWGKNWFLLPNPSYGSWERALYDFKSGLTDAQKLERKYEALRIGPRQ